MDFKDFLLLPARNTGPPRSLKTKLQKDEHVGFQIDIFSCLALNKTLGGLTANLDNLDLEMNPEAVFYTCRAIRRMLLGVHWYPVVVQQQARVSTVQGEPYTGEGLIINSDGLHLCRQIETQNYIQTVYSMEVTDNMLIQWNSEARVVYCPSLTHTLINPQIMFRIISRYISMSQMESCYMAFDQTLKNKSLKKICKQNYFLLIEHLLYPTLTYMPKLSNMSQDSQLQFYQFNARSFLDDWFQSPSLFLLKTKIISNMYLYPHILTWLCRLPKCSEIPVLLSELVANQKLASASIPNLKVILCKKNPGNKPMKVLVSTADLQQWLVYPPELPIYRVVMCMTVAEGFLRNLSNLTDLNTTHQPRPPLPEIVASMFRRGMYAPRETKKTQTINFRHVFQQTCSQPTGPDSLFNDFSPMEHLSVNDFKINIFNTNMVINTKITCVGNSNKYNTILDIPRLTNNFVVKKYSVKEPSFTVSVFYSDDSCSHTAININISGDLMTFLFAMCSLKCFLPIQTILPISIANWNSTLDLQGLENQNIVRSGRTDVFWTTNFPSAVSTKKGYNVSWFKAATATVSKIHGDALVSQIHNETTQILNNTSAKINLNKNLIFTTLENRNRAQIQTMHKRFLECLYECTAHKKLNVNTLKKLAYRGYFDFSKKIISHTKNKHECAVLGYKKCNLIPKVLCNRRKIRLDELGRNANFMTFVFTHYSKSSPENITTNIP
ncbi:protein UL87 [Vespertilionid gammaherpesvirus 1]|uniref:Protein UL87 n=1 Tax=Vespertilionid gammaherpesvirus 1 TaxID=2560830 RepID=A0A0X9XD30_9GAMA|nr:protein UL87 [Myotis gammaherpesvirus 8]AMA67381.1 protein UL87 [Vespertilionid gammaherpesvirus 1]